MTTFIVGYVNFEHEVSASGLFKKYASRGLVQPLAHD